MQLDALGELANVGSATAGEALAQMLGRPVDLSVPSVRALPFGEAVETAGPAEQTATAVVLPVVGDVEATVLLLFDEADAAQMCTLLGVDPEDEVADSALGEIGNILGSSYVNALGSTIGLELEPAPPAILTDMLGAIVASVLAAGADLGDTAIVLDSALEVEDAECSLEFMLVPTAEGVSELLSRLGLGE